MFKPVRILYFVFIFLSFLFFKVSFAFEYNPTVSFDKNLKIGMTDNDVRELQIFLNNNGFIVSETGPGSIGNETYYFGQKTKKAVINFQENYKNYILEPLSLKNGTGFFYSSTREFINKNISKTVENTPVIKIIIPSTTSTSSVIVNLLNGVISTSSDSIQQEISTTTNSLIKNTYTINYIAEYGGEILGNSTQIIEENATGTEVTAISASNYYFIDWSDGLTTSTRTDSNLTEDRTIYANFGYRKRGSQTTINISEILGFVAPVKLQNSVSNITENGQFSGTITWSPNHRIFNANTVYTATINIIPKIGFTLNGVEENFFTVDGIDSTSTNAINSGIITMEFPATEVFTDDDLVTFVYNGSEVTYGLVQNSTTGDIWLDRNLGASRVALSATDTEAYGDLFQWGRDVDGHQLRTSGITGVLADSDTPGHSDFIFSVADTRDWRSDNNTNRWNAVPIVNNPCPTGFRLPTKIELEAEKLSWSNDGVTGAFNSPLKLTTAGVRRYSDGVIYNEGVTGAYWSGSLDINNVWSRYVYFHDDVSFMASHGRAYGMSVRCIRN